MVRVAPIERVIFGLDGLFVICGASEWGEKCGCLYVQRRAIQCISCILKFSGSAKKMGRGKREEGHGSRRGKDGLVEKERGVEGEEGEWEIGIGEA